jgi:3-methylcrotonyl-CoA carboxylase alpha subunit
MFASSPRPIRSVLVANRGEIAIRVLRTCKRLGLRGIAVYSEADRDSLHVRVADAALPIGPASARESYLSIPAIIAAAKEARADAIHPGYGFLSENAAFARACEEAGLIFIGPSVDAVARMGSKIESKRIAETVGVPGVPGYHGESQDDSILAKEATRIGYPVLIKASAGGGGRGMRRVDHATDFAAALNAARSEAQAAFGDSQVLLEKFILDPRHLEVQLAGDRHGNLVHLFERDCSVQRNNQKVLEEAPAPNLPDSVRQKLFSAALKLGRAIGYDSVGTVEFIMDANGDEPYFLEMNTRLQVEHPVTEAITGVDLVEWQLRAAAGEVLPLTQGQIHQTGHAIEARITAERADRDFQSVTGQLSIVQAPTGLRFDSGVVTGSSVSLYYDSLLAKLISHSRTRAEACATLAQGLEDLTLLGLPSTQPFLRDALRHPIFVEGQATTRFIPKAYIGGWQVDVAELNRLRAAAALAWLPINDEPAGKEDTWVSPWLRYKATRVTASARPVHIDLLLHDEYGSCELQVLVGRNDCQVLVDGALASPVPTPRFQRTEKGLSITKHGLAITAAIELKVDASRVGDGLELGGNQVNAPLHGVVSQIYVSAGDTVLAGTAVIQMEAMKLIHTLNAPTSGTIAAIRCAVGDTVPAGAILIDITPENE